MQLSAEFEEFEHLSTKQVERLKKQAKDISQAIEVSKSELGDSERPMTSNSNRSNFQNATMTSDFSIKTVDVEDLRQQLSTVSIELEE